MLPNADLVCNLTPDKQHHSVIPVIMPLMKKGAAVLSYSHGFSIVEEGQQIRQDTVIMVAPKRRSSEVRAGEYVRGLVCQLLSL